MHSYELSFGEQIIAVFDTGLPLFTFELNNIIDEEKLKEAVEDALIKHPLYKSKLVLENGLYKYVYNNLDPVILHTSWEEPIEYGTKLNNYYPWIIIVDGANIHFAAAHSLSDGIGASQFIKTVLVAYLEKVGLKFSGNIDISVNDAPRTTEISSEKYLDDNNKALYVPKEREVIDTSPGLYENDISKVSGYNITVNKKDIKKMAMASETSTFASLAAVLAIAYDKMLNVSEGNIKIEVPFNLRGFWNSISDHNFVAMPSLYYDVAQMKDKDIKLVQTAFRSQLDIYMDITNQVYQFNQDYKMKQMLKAKPEMLKQMSKELTDRLFLPKASIVLTHLGNLRYPKELLDEIVDFKMTSGLYPGSMMAAVGFMHNENITLHMVQATKNDVYIDKLKDVLDQYNIPYKCKKLVPHGAITFDVPK